MIRTQPISNIYFHLGSDSIRLVPQLPLLAEQDGLYKILLHKCIVADNGNSTPSRSDLGKTISTMYFIITDLHCVGNLGVQDYFIPSSTVQF